MLNNISGTEMVKTYDNQRSRGKETQPVISRLEALVPEDKVSLDERPSEAITYGIPQKAGVTTSDYISLREMLVNILQDQGITTRIAAGDTSINFKDLTPEQAQELVSEDGYFGVDQTSDRIVQLAISLNDNDPGRLEEIKAGIEKGFQMAAKSLGGTLPDVSMKTYSAVMEKIDAWGKDPHVA